MAQLSKGFASSSKDVAGAKVLEISGAIDADSYPRFDQAVFSLIDTGTTKLILVLEKVPMINSMGIGIIARAFRKLKEAGGGLVLLNPSSQVRQVLFIQALEKTLPITGQLDDALRLLGPAPAPAPAPAPGPTGPSRA